MPAEEVPEVSGCDQPDFLPKPARGLDHWAVPVLFHIGLGQVCDRKHIPKLSRVRGSTFFGTRLGKSPW
jgi:hypothetical protein